MRIGLLGEGTYPVVKGGVSTWYDQLVRRLDDHDFDVVTLTGSDQAIRWEMPKNVTSLTFIDMWGAPKSRARRQHRGDRHELLRILDNLWSAILPADERDGPDLERSTVALKRLVSRKSDIHLGRILPSLSSAAGLVRAWEAHRWSRPDLPHLTLAQAAEAVRLVDRMLSIMDTPWPEVDVIHLSSNGPVALLALARKWTYGTPIILSEHGVYLRERYLALNQIGMDWAVRYAVMGFVRTICQITYAESTLLTPVSYFNAKWEQHLGAEPAAVFTVHNGVDAEQYSPITTEPDTPTITFVGRIDPLKDLHTLIEAFRLVRETIPEATLRLFGPTPSTNLDYRASLEDLIAIYELEDSITFEGALPSARPGFEAGHVVALSSISEGLPYTVIEAMMCGRATVSTDVGGVSECAGTDGVAGLVVPPRDPRAMADALITLLTDDDRRAAMGKAARRRACDMFDITKFEQRYRRIYAMCASLPGGTPHLEPLELREADSLTPRPTPSYNTTVLLHRETATTKYLGSDGFTKKTTTPARHAQTSSSAPPAAVPHLRSRMGIDAGGTA